MSCKPMNQSKRKPDDDQLQSLQCPVCLTFAFDAVINNTCGHTMCEICSQHATKCPVCRKPKGEFVPNFMVRTALETTVELRDEYNQFKHNQLLKTPKGFIAHIKQKYPDMVFKTASRFNDSELSCILKWIDSRLSDPILQKNIHPFGHYYTTIWIKTPKEVHLSYSYALFECTVSDYTIMVIGAVTYGSLRDAEDGWEKDKEMQDYDEDARFDQHYYSDSD